MDGVDGSSGLLRESWRGIGPGLLIRPSSTEKLPWFTIALHPVPLRSSTVGDDTALTPAGGCYWWLAHQCSAGLDRRHRWVIHRWHPEPTQLSSPGAVISYRRETMRGIVALRCDRSGRIG